MTDSHNREDKPVTARGYKGPKWLIDNLPRFKGAKTMSEKSREKAKKHGQESGKGYSITARLPTHLTKPKFWLLAFAVAGAVVGGVAVIQRMAFTPYQAYLTGLVIMGFASKMLDSMASMVRVGENPGGSHSNNND